MYICCFKGAKAGMQADLGYEQKTNDEYLKTVPACIPEDFSGRLLEAPVGTGVLSMPVYSGGELLLYKKSWIGFNCMY